MLEVVTLNAIERRTGVGNGPDGSGGGQRPAAALSRDPLTTTNDNLDAIRFYQRRGLRLVALRRAPSTGPAGETGNSPGRRLRHSAARRNRPGPPRMSRV